MCFDLLALPRVFQGARKLPCRKVQRPKKPGPRNCCPGPRSTCASRIFLNCLLSAPQRSRARKLHLIQILLLEREAGLVLQAAMSAPSASHSLSIHRGDDDDMMVQEEDLAMIREMPPMSSHLGTFPRSVSGPRLPLFRLCSFLPIALP